MKLELKILRDLEAGQSTLESMCPRVGANRTAVLEILQRLEEEKTIISYKIMDVLTVYKIRKPKP